MRGLEIEGYYVSSEKVAILNNPTDRPFEHTFRDTFSLRMGVLLANWLLVWKNKSIVSPYIGIGVGTAMMHIHDADSSQMDPVEAGINHFNSDPSDTDWVFATQGKAGLRFDFFKHMRLFAEYRFLYLTSSDYTFGSTKYPSHAATTKWKVHFDGICNNMWAVGIDFPW
jgi:opacity protein-like surface antigen